MSVTGFVPGWQLVRAHHVAIFDVTGIDGAAGLAAAGAISVPPTSWPRPALMLDDW
jgi:hypothetical protein